MAEVNDVNVDTINGGRRGTMRSSSVTEGNSSASGIGHLITILEDHKEELGLEYYSVSPTTLDQVFLSIVGRHNVEEENYAPTRPKRRWVRIWGKKGGS